MTVFGERIKLLRSEKNILQKDIAEYLNLHVRTYQYYEASTLEPSLENLVKLADYFQVSTDYLLGRSDNQNMK